MLSPHDISQGTDDQQWLTAGDELMIRIGFTGSLLVVDELIASLPRRAKRTTDMAKLIAPNGQCDLGRF